jgi:hypothetical protein
MVPFQSQQEQGDDTHWSVEYQRRPCQNCGMRLIPLVMVWSIAGTGAATMRCSDILLRCWDSKQILVSEKNQWRELDAHQKKPGRQPGFGPTGILESKRSQTFIILAVFIIQISVPHSTNLTILADEVKWGSMHGDLLARLCGYRLLESIAKPEASSLAPSARKDHAPVHHPHTSLPFSASCFGKLFC